MNPRGNLRSKHGAHANIANIAKRYGFLVLLLTAVGAAGGYYYHLQFPAQHFASVRLPLNDPASTKPDVHGPGSIEHPVGYAESLIVSQEVLREATEIGDLNKTPAFHRWNTDSIVAVLSQTLQIELIREPDSDRYIQVSFRSGDAETPQRVVHAFVTAYENHLQASFFEARKVTADHLQSARLATFEQLEKLEQEFATFRQSVSIFDSRGDISRSYRDKADKLLIQKQRLIIRRMELESKINAESDDSDSLGRFDAEHTELVESTIRLDESSDLPLSVLRHQLAEVDHQLSELNHTCRAVLELAAAEKAEELRAKDFIRKIEFQQANLDKLLSQLEAMLTLSDVAQVRNHPLELISLQNQGSATRSSSLVSGAALGFSFAFFLICLRELFDTAYRNERQISEHLGFPVIGTLPAIRGGVRATNRPSYRISPSLASYYRPDGLFADSIHSVLESLYFRASASNLKVLQVTSPTPGDHKSTIAANLAIAVAQSGKRVLLVDADFNSPKVHRLFGLSIEKGTAWLLQHLPKRPLPGEIEEMLDEVIIDSPIENLSVIGMGYVQPGFSVLTLGNQFDNLSSVWSDLFDVVIIDSQSLLDATDPQAVALKVDGVLLVLRLTKTAKWVMARALRRIDKFRLNVLGIVVCGVDSRSHRVNDHRTCSRGRFHGPRLYRPGNDTPDVTALDFESPRNATRDGDINEKATKTV